jgi:hypothetical protein
MRLALGSTLQGFVVVTCAVLLVVGSYSILLALVSGHLAQTWLSQSSNLRLVSPLVSGLTFAKPVVWAWALVIPVSAAIRRYAPRKPKNPGSHDEEK